MTLSFLKTLVQGLWMALVFTVVLGLGYPWVMTTFAQLVFPAQANGSLVSAEGRVVGSALIGQDWSASPKWLQGRPSATGGSPYNPQASGGSNLSPHGAALLQARADRQAAWAATGLPAPVPEALLTASASGLDPELDLQAALWQAPRIAEARRVPLDQVEAVIRSQVLPLGWPWDPAPRVNVLAVNLALEGRAVQP